MPTGLEIRKDGQLDVVAFNNLKTALCLMGASDSFRDFFGDP